jgi:hypothetical protein
LGAACAGARLPLILRAQCAIMKVIKRRRWYPHAD